jgi:hypothetical protein
MISNSGSGESRTIIRPAGCRIVPLRFQCHYSVVMILLGTLPTGILASSFNFTASIDETVFPPALET